jgi:ParB family chromosome partitioning protein
MSAEKKRGLGRGLDALFRDVREEEQSHAARDAENRNAAEATAFKPLRADELVNEATKLRQDLQPIEYKSRAPDSPPADAAPVANKQAAESPAKDAVRFIKIEKLRPGKFQPRQLFSEAEIDELAESIATYGILQPLLARPVEGGMHEIIGGERRWRAAQKARLHEVPVIVRALDDKQALEVGLIENLQREDLTPMEEAESYQRLMDEFGHTQETLSVQLGKSRPHIANLLRILKLPESVRALVQKGAISAGHARALLNANDPGSIAGDIVAKGLSVRQVERMARGQKGVANGLKTPRKSAKGGLVLKDPDILALERRMSNILGLNITIETEPGFSASEGRLCVEYSSLDQLDDLLARLSMRPPI